MNDSDDFQTSPETVLVMPDDGKQPPTGDRTLPAKSTVIIGGFSDQAGAEQTVLEFLKGMIPAGTQVRVQLVRTPWLFEGKRVHAAKVHIPAFEWPR